MKKKLLPSLDGPSNLIRDAWDRVRRVPGGGRLFSAMLGKLVPYSGSIGAEVLELEAGRAVVLLRDRRAVRNHLRSVHAIALANLAELTGNLALAYGLPDDGRFIVSGLTMEYLKKARGPIKGVCTCEVPPDSTKREYLVPVSMIDESGAEVARCTLKTLVGPKPSTSPTA